MRTYIAVYNRKQIELQAASLYDAKVAAIKQFKIPKSKQGLLAIVLADKPVHID